LSKKDHPRGGNLPFPYSKRDPLIDGHNLDFGRISFHYDNAIRVRAMSIRLCGRALSLTDKIVIRVPAGVVTGSGRKDERIYHISLQGNEMPGVPVATTKLLVTAMLAT
jgi:hypothetical protein